MTTLEETLAHFGVKGMKWGVRRAPRTIHSPSEDHTRADTVKKKAKQGGKKALSNKELQDLITRMNLEQQYDRIAPSTKKKLVISGAKLVSDILLGVGKQQAARFANDQATKLLASVLKK